VNVMSLDYTETGPSRLPNCTGGRETSRTPAAAKRKGGDPAQKLGMSPRTPSASETESDEDRDAQIWLDAKIAAAWQERERRRIKKDKQRQSKEQALLEKVRDLENRLAEASKQPSPGTAESNERIKKKQKTTHSSTAGSRTEASESRRTRLHERPSKQLPKKSNLRRAMFERDGPNDNPDSSSSSDDEPNNNPRRPIVSSDSEQSLFPEEPDSTDSDDSAATKLQKRRAKRRYRAKMLKLRYQQNFLKVDPPFVYKGEVQARVFKKWVRETRLYLKYSGLSCPQSLDIIGKYLGKRAYKYYEQEILSKRRKLTLSQFFAGLFDYIFPPDFRAQQRDRFDKCSQHGRTVRDFLQRLRDLANTIGDLKDKDIVLAFWRRCESYLRIELTRDGYSANSISLETLEELSVQHERTHNLLEREARKSEHGDSDQISIKLEDSGSEISDVQTSSQYHTGSDSDQDGVSDSSLGLGNDKNHCDRHRHHRLNSFTDMKRESRDYKAQAEKERKNRLRSEGRCFQCESKGHMYRECPEVHHMANDLEKPNVLSNAVYMADYHDDSTDYDSNSDAESLSNSSHSESSYEYFNY
jgi:hypothetical protein